MEISQLKMIPFLGDIRSFLFVEHPSPEAWLTMPWKVGRPFFSPHELIGGLKVAAWEAPPNHLHENTLEGHGTRNQQTFLECTCEGAGSWGAEETGAGGGGGFGKQWGGGIGA